MTPESPETMSLWTAALLGAVQGATEFLPVSSSGHLALAAKLPFVSPGATAEPPLLFDLLLHVATVIAVFKAFWKDFWDYLAHRRAIVLWIVLACVPTAIGGVFFKAQFESVRASGVAVSAMLLVTAIILTASRWLPPGDRTLDRLGVARSLGVGLAQCVAITPGISRSGTTIVAGLAAGLSREDAVKFSFSLMVPTVLGAVALETLEKLREGGPLMEGLSPMACGVGFVVALGVGLASLSLLRWVVDKNKLVYFAVYCALVGGTGLVYFGLFHEPAPAVPATPPSVEVVALVFR